MLDRRLQVLVDDDIWSRLEDEAGRRGVPVAVLVREAIDARFPGNAEARRAALSAVLEADPMDVPDPDQLRGELDAIRSRSA